jgi:hypothetical protein
MSAPTPLLDFFKRGEVARDVRLLAAAGALAPRAHEQLSILVLLLDDADREIRTTAQATLDRIPVESLAMFLARSDVPIGVREFFADRGVFPAEMPALTADDPLLDTEADEAVEVATPDAESEEVSRDSLIQQLATMSFTDRLKAAMKGSREMRSILIRDPNKMISAAVLSSPKLSESEVEGFARMTNVSEEVLRVIAGNRAWTKSYSVIVGLAKNPKTPLGLSLNLMARLNDRDVDALSKDRNIPEALRSAARRRVAASHQ